MVSGGQGHTASSWQSQNYLEVLGHPPRALPPQLMVTDWFVESLQTLLLWRANTA